MTINIIGAGMAGLLAANMLRHRDPVIYEVQSKLPNNHSAVLRFRTPAVGDILNIPFKKVTMIKAHVPWSNPIADALSYSFKNSGEYRSDRSIIAGLTTADRWVAPSDFIQRMMAQTSAKINLNNEYNFVGNNEKIPVISTIPMPALMKALSYVPKDEVSFNSISGVNIKAKVDNCESYISLLVPNPTIPFSRVSITGNELSIECPAKDGMVDNYAKLCIGVAAGLLGIDDKKFKDITIHQQKYAKITPIDDDARKSFMFWATDDFNIYSLGRFATWRPGLLLDDLIQDIRHIDRWISQGKYSIARHR